MCVRVCVRVCVHALVCVCVCPVIDVIPLAVSFFLTLFLGIEVSSLPPPFHSSSPHLHLSILSSSIDTLEVFSVFPVMLDTPMRVPIMVTSKLFQLY